MKIRKSFFAGQFYPSNEAEMNKLIEYIDKIEQNNVSHIKDAEIDVLGGVVPHAGMTFCGYQAVHYFHYIKSVEVDTFVIISPSHKGRGPGVSIDSNRIWEIPGTSFRTDQDLIESNLFETSEKAQLGEHAAEVMLPYLNYYRDDLKDIAVVTMRDQTVENAREIAQKLYEYEKTSGKKLQIIASSDFNHFEAAETGREKDDKVLEAILTKNEEDVYKAVKKHHVSVCGFGPIMTLIAYSKLKDKNARMGVLRRGHSGDIVPSPQVVDYISILSSVSKHNH